MKRLKEKLLNRLLGPRVFCLISNGRAGKIIVKGSASDLCPRIVEAIDYSPAVRALILTAVAEYLRAHEKEKLAFSKRIYNN